MYVNHCIRVRSLSTLLRIERAEVSCNKVFMRAFFSAHRADNHTINSGGIAMLL